MVVAYRPRGLRVFPFAVDRGHGSSGAADQSNQPKPFGYGTVFTVSACYFPQTENFHSVAYMHPCSSQHDPKIGIKRRSRLRFAVNWREWVHPEMGWRQCCWCTAQPLPEARCASVACHRPPPLRFCHQSSVIDIFSFRYFRFDISVSRFNRRHLRFLTRQSCYYGT